MVMHQMVCVYCRNEMEKFKEYAENYHEGISYTEYVCPECGATVVASYYDVFWTEGEDGGYIKMIDELVDEINSSRNIKVTYSFKDNEVVFKTQYDNFSVGIYEFEHDTLKNELLDLTEDEDD